MKIVICSGYFNPLGPHHINYLKESRKLGDYLIVGVNSDACSYKKKGCKSFMSFEDRCFIVKHLEMVDEATGFYDNDGTACSLITDVFDKYPDAQLIFSNGGDKTKENTPENKFFNKRVKFVYGVGGFEKVQSSSKYLQEWIDENNKI